MSVLSTLHPSEDFGIAWSPTGCCTKWVEAKALQDNTNESVARFLYENIMTRFICSMELVSNQGSHFINKVVQSLTLTHVIIHRKSIVYCSQVNSFNKVDKQNLVEIIEENCE